MAMETDKAKLLHLLKEFGVGFTVTDSEIKSEVKCDQGADRVTGHYGYYTTFVFDSHGHFIEMGAWE
jgi:hypothetical protein